METLVAMAVAMEKIVLLFRFRQFRLFNAEDQVKYFHGSIHK